MIGHSQLVAEEISRSPLIAGAGDLPEPGKFGGKRMIKPSMIPAIVSALRAREWLPQDAASNHEGVDDA